MSESHPDRKTGDDVENAKKYFLNWAQRELRLESVDPEAPLIGLGIDSVRAAELLTILDERYDTEISVEELFDGLCIADLADRVVAAGWRAGESEGEPLVAAQSAVTEHSRDCGVEFSLLFFASDAQQRGKDRYRLLLQAARFADTRGFTGVWIPERHFHTFGGLYPNPAVLGAALAASTERLRIRAGSVVLPLHNPVRVAEDWSVVDNLSHGRVDVAFATGWNADDFVLAPERYRDRVAATRSGMETVHRLWGGQSVELDNGLAQTRSVRIFPSPVQSALPTWLTCTGNVERFEMAGELGVNVLTALLFQDLEELAEKIAVYRKVRARHGHDADSGTVTVMLHTFLGQDEAMVRRTVSGPLRAYLEDSIDLWRSSWTQLDSVQGPARAKALDFAVERYYRTHGLFGTPASTRSMVEKLRQAGANEIACLVDFGIAEAEVLTGLESLADLVHQTSGGK